MTFKSAAVVGLIGLASLALALHIPQTRVLILGAPPPAATATTGIIGAIGEAFTGFF